MKYVFSNNPYLQALAEKVIRQKTDSDMAEWVCNNTTLAGGPFSLKNRGYQRAVLADMHPNLCCKKLSQIGMTECQIRKALGFMVMNPGTRVLYTFPTKILKDNNSAPRIRPIFDTDFPGQGDIRNNNILQIGSSFLYISGGSESDVTSTPVDMILNDEIDLGTSEFMPWLIPDFKRPSIKLNKAFPPLPLKISVSQLIIILLTNGNIL